MNSTDDEDEKLKRSLMQFSMQMLHRPIRFSVCGMFELDYRIILTVKMIYFLFSFILTLFYALTDERSCDSLLSDFISAQKFGNRK